MHTTSKQIELESPGCSGFEGNSNTFPTIIYFLVFSSLLRLAMRQKHLLTFSLLLVWLLSTALVLALLFWQTPKCPNSPI